MRSVTQIVYSLDAQLLWSVKITICQKKCTNSNHQQHKFEETVSWQQLYGANQVPLQKFKGSQPHQETLHITWNTKVHYHVKRPHPMTLSWARWIQSTFSSPNSLISISLLSSHLQGEHKVFPWLQTFITRKLGTAVAQWLRRCATNQEVASSIPDGAIGILHWCKILPIALWPWGWLSL